MAWTEELERAASAGKPMPHGLTTAEKHLYIAMRGLYEQYRQGLIDLDGARREKRMLLADAGKFDLLMQSAEKSLRTWQWLNLRIEDDDCPKCRELKRQILQLENAF